MLGKNKKKASAVIKNSEEENQKDPINSELEKEEIARHLDLLQDILENTQNNIKKALNLLKEKDIDTQALLDSLAETKEASGGFVASSNGKERIVEGVFTGEIMVGGDGIEYNVPANYASKSKLVEGDILKLTIANNGSFIYKQIGPVERKQLVAVLAKNEQNGEWFAIEDGQRWKLLTASVTYFHGSAGDEVVILVPKDSKSKWAAVENVIRNGNR